MAIQKNDLIKIINEYRSSISKKAIPAGLDLNQVNDYVRYLNNLILNTQGDDVQIVTPEDAQKVSQAVNTLSSISNLSTVGSIKKKIKRGYEIAEVLAKNAPRDGSIINDLTRKLIGTKTELSKDDVLKQKSAFTDSSEELAYSQSVRTLKMVKDLQNNWLHKKDYVYFPADGREINKSPELAGMYSEYARKKVDTSFYQNLSSALPTDQRIRVQSFINSLNDVNNKFAYDKESYTYIISNVIKRYEEKARTSGANPDNIIVNIGELSEAEREAFQQIEYMEKMPAQKEIFKKEAAFLDDLQRIYATFSRAPQTVLEKSALEAKQRQTVQGTVKKYQDNTPYDLLNDKEKAALEAEGQKIGLTGENYYKHIVGKEELAPPKAPEPAKDEAGLFNRERVITTPTEEDVSSQNKQSEAPINKPGRTVEEKARPFATPQSATAASMPQWVVPPEQAGIVVGPDGTSIVSGSQEPEKINFVETAVVRNRKAMTQPMGQPTIIPVVNDDAKVTIEIPSTPEYQPDEVIGMTTEAQADMTPFPEYTAPTQTAQPESMDVISGLRDDFKFDDSQPVTPDAIGSAAENIQTGKRVRDVTGQDDIVQDMRESLSEQPGIYDGLAKPLVAGTIQPMTEDIVNRMQYSVFNLRIPSREEREHLALIRRRQDIFTTRMIQGDYIGAFADMPSLLGPSYGEQMWGWVNQKALTISKNVKDQVSTYVIRKLNNNKFYSTWKGRITKAKGSLIKAYKTWEKSGSKLGGFIKQVRFIPLLAKRKKKKQGAYIAEAIAKQALKAIVGGVKLLAAGYVATANGIKNIVSLPKRWINSPTSIYKKAGDFAGIDVAKQTNKIIGNVSDAVGSVRRGLIKVGVVMGDVASIAKSIGRPLANIIDSAPQALAATLFVGLGTGWSIPAMAVVGGVSLATNSIAKLLSQDHTDILIHAEKFGKFDNWGLLGKGIHKIADFTRIPYQQLQKISSGGIKKAIANGDLTDPLKKEALQTEIGRRNGLFTVAETRLRSFNTGLLAGSIAFGLSGGNIGIALIGAAAGAAAQRYIIDPAINKMTRSIAAGKLNALFGLPVWETANTFADVAGLGQELSVIQKKYGWNFGEYFKNEFKNPLIAIGRISNWIQGVWGITKLPRILIAFMRSPLTVKFATWLAKGLPVKNLVPIAKSVGWQTLLGWGLSLGILTLLGVPLTPTVIAFSLGGSLLAGTTATALIAAGVVSGPVGWVTLGVVTFVTITATFFGWIGSLIDKAFGNVVNRALTMFNGVISGIQSLFEILRYLSEGLSLKNILPFILACMSLLSIYTTINYLQTMDATNSCTTKQECVKQNASSPFISEGGTLDYLAYYDVTVISKDENARAENIQRVLSLLSENPLILNKTFGAKTKYLYIGDTSDIYTNEEMAVVAINKQQLFSNYNISYLIDQSRASID